MDTLYPWTRTSPPTPIVAAAPMRIISSPSLACAASLAGGIGFLGGGTDVSNLGQMLEESVGILRSKDSVFKNGYVWEGSTQDDKQEDYGVLPVGVGFLMWGVADTSFENTVVPLVKKYKPCAVWLFAPAEDPSAPHSLDYPVNHLARWTQGLRAASKDTVIWIQLGSIAETKAVLQSIPDVEVLVVQSGDAGGHGLEKHAGLMTLLPEVRQYIDGLQAGTIADDGIVRNAVPNPYLIAAGGLATAAQFVACKVLGASGIALGTRFLAAPESNIAAGYRAEIIRAEDGGQTTVRSKVYDILRGTPGWPKRYNGRGVKNLSWEDWQAGASGKDQLENLYKDAESKSWKDDTKQDTIAWGPKGRMTTYAGSGVGLVKSIQPAEDIVQELHHGYHRIAGKSL